MPLHVQCPHCLAVLPNIERSLPRDGSNVVPCPECGELFRVATSPVPPTPAPVPAIADVNVSPLPELDEPDIQILEAVPTTEADAPQVNERTNEEEEIPVLETVSDPAPANRPSSRKAPAKRRPGLSAPPLRRPPAGGGKSVIRYVLFAAGGIGGLILAIVLFARNRLPTEAEPRAEPASEKSVTRAETPDPVTPPGPPFVFPPVEPVALRRTRLENDREERDLPGVVTQSVVGGGGRFLLLNLSAEKKVAVFDTAEADVIQYLPLPSERAMIAAGMEWLMVVDPVDRLVQRYSLLTREKVATYPLEQAARARQVLMGSASNGPLVLCLGDGPKGAVLKAAVLDPLTGEEFKFEGERQLFPEGFDPAIDLRVSANGRLFTRYAGQSANPRGTYAMQPDGFVATRLTGPLEGPIFPSPMGNYVCSAGIYSPDGKLLDRFLPAWYNLTLPAAEGETFYLNADLRRFKPGGEERAALSVRRYGDPEPLFALPTVRGPESLAPRWASPGFDLDRRVLLFPTAGLLVVVPDGRDKLELYRIDFDAALKDSERDYLFVLSQPPALTAKGRQLEYPLEIKSRYGGAKVMLASGPPGMRVVGETRVEWDVPKDFPAGNVEVVLTVADRGGAEATHRFTLSVGDKLPEGAPHRIPTPTKEIAARAIEIPATRFRVPKAEGLRTCPLEGTFEVRDLPGPVEVPRIGGGGRYLVWATRPRVTLGVLDTNTGKVRYLDRQPERVLFAANRTELLVADLAAARVDRYELETLDKVGSFELPQDASDYSRIGMGSGSDGPLVCMRTGDRRNTKPFDFLDSISGKKVDLDYGKLGDEIVGVTADQVSITADGRRLRFLPPFYTLAGLVLGETRLEPIRFRPPPTERIRHAGDYLLPSADGSAIYGAGQLFDGEGRPISDRVNTQERRVSFLPAVEGPLFISLAECFDQKAPSLPPKIGIHPPGSVEPLVELPPLEGSEELRGQVVADPFPFSRHVFYFPSADLLVVVPKSKHQLYLHRIDLDSSLKNANGDYLFVTGPTSGDAWKGARWEAQVTVFSRKEKIQAVLRAAPPWMALSPEGKLTWEVPDDYPEAEVEVVLVLSDGVGKNLTHRLRLRLKR